MKQVKFQIQTTKENFFTDYFNAVNGSIGLSNKEIVVLAALVEQYNIIRKKTDNEDIINELLFSSRHRTLAREKVDISDLNFNNYISALKRKGVILEEENKFRKINPMLVPIVDIEQENGLDLVFNFIIEDDGASIDREEIREEPSTDEISPFEFPETTEEEESDTDEPFRIFDEPQDADQLYDGDTE
jgi:SOS-response transcriptional repressor LexA